MGTEIRSAIEETDDITITGIVSPEHIGEKCESKGLALEAANSLEDLKSQCELPEVIVDFTIANAAYENALFAANHNVSFVSGTTGLSDEQKNTITQAFTKSLANAIIAPNFSVGVVLMMHFSAVAAKHFSHAEIIETHHIQKKDAPSGTALATQKMMTESSNLSETDIPIHSLRLPGAVAHQQVHLSSKGEILRIEHDANDRSCFMPGLILAIRKVNEVNNIQFSIEPLLFPED